MSEHSRRKEKDPSKQPDGEKSQELLPGIFKAGITAQKWLGLISLAFVLKLTYDQDAELALGIAAYIVAKRGLFKLLERKSRVLVGLAQLGVSSVVAVILLPEIDQVWNEALEVNQEIYNQVLGPEQIDDTIHFLESVPSELAVFLVIFLLFYSPLKILVQEGRARLAKTASSLIW